MLQLLAITVNVRSGLFVLTFQLHLLTVTLAWSEVMALREAGGFLCDRSQRFIGTIPA